MLMLTRSCELRCSDCFVSLTEQAAGVDHSGEPDPTVLTDPPGQPLGDMSIPTRHRAVDWLMASERPKLGLHYAETPGPRPGTPFSCAWTTTCPGS